MSEVPDEVARRLRWYRRHILPRLDADVNGHLFVTEMGSRKSQTTLTVQIIDAIARHIGIHMTPHQFRHFGATSYLEDHPEDFETAREHLGHAFSKMCIHDFRRAAATFLAIDAPEKIGLIPGVLQHASPDPGDQHYNLKRTVQAGRRFTAHLANARNRLRPLATRSGIVHADTTAAPN